MEYLIFFPNMCAGVYTLFVAPYIYLTLVLVSICVGFKNKKYSHMKIELSLLFAVALSHLSLFYSKVFMLGFSSFYGSIEGTGNFPLFAFGIGIFVISSIFLFRLNNFVLKCISSINFLVAFFSVVATIYDLAIHTTS